MKAKKNDIMIKPKKLVIEINTNKDINKQILLIIKNEQEKKEFENRIQDYKQDFDLKIQCIDNDFIKTQLENDKESIRNEG